MDRPGERRTERPTWIWVNRSAHTRLESDYRGMNHNTWLLSARRRLIENIDPHIKRGKDVDQYYLFINETIKKDVTSEMLQTVMSQSVI